MNWRQDFQNSVRPVDNAFVQTAVAAAKRGERQGRLDIAASLAWAAYACPDATYEVYDVLASAWLGRGPTSDIPSDKASAPLEESFWEAYWAVIDGAEEGYDATTITVAVASLGGAVHEDFAVLAETLACRHPGADQAQQKQVPGLTDIEGLAQCPTGSLGRELYDLLTANGYDPEVLDRNEIMLNALPPALRYLNTRILQMHDVWHLVAGYETTGSQEIAISSFQLAQFPHNYSSMFLAAVSMISHIQAPQGFNILMQIICEAWQHGRQTPVMMAIEWEEEWNTPMEEVREKYGISTLRTVFPADLMETMGEGSFWAKLKLGWQLARFNRRVRAEAA